MQTTQSFHREREESNALMAAGFSSVFHLSVVSFDKTGTCLGSSFDNIGRAERAGHGHIYFSIFPIALAADGHITRAGDDAW